MKLSGILLKLNIIRITQILVRGLKPNVVTIEPVACRGDSNNPNPRQGIKTHFAGQIKVVICNSFE